MKTRTWSRKKIKDEFSGLLKRDGTPMSRQQIHMVRKRARGLCLTCGAPAIGVYCLKHTIAARERMRRKLKYRRRLRKSASYVLEQKVRVRGGGKPAGLPRRSGPRPRLGGKNTPVSSRR